MFETPREHHRYDESNPRRSTRRIWQGPGIYHVVLIQQGNDSWVGHWSSRDATTGRLSTRADLEEFLDWAAHVVDNARKVGMVDEREVDVYGFHERQMGDHVRILGMSEQVITDSSGDVNPRWMRIRNRHPFVPDSYVRLDEIDDLGPLDFDDLGDGIRAVADEIAEITLGHGLDGEAADATSVDDAEPQVDDAEPQVDASKPQVDEGSQQVDEGQGQQVEYVSFRVDGEEAEGQDLDVDGRGGAETE